MAKVVFIDEQWFDMDEHEDYEEYEGFSKLSVYDIPEFDEEGKYNEEEDNWEDWDRDDYDIVGTALIGFDYDNDAHVLEVDVEEGDFDESDVELYYPPL